jgi:hypothetical protein
VFYHFYVAEILWKLLPEGLGESVRRLGNPALIEETRPEFDNNISSDAGRKDFRSKSGAGKTGFCGDAKRYGQLRRHSVTRGFKRPEDFSELRKE